MCQAIFVELYEKFQVKNNCGNFICSHTKKYVVNDLILIMYVLEICNINQYLVSLVF
jgi:hypothetical protein